MHNLRPNFLAVGEDSNHHEYNLELRRGKYIDPKIVTLFGGKGSKERWENMHYAVQTSIFLWEYLTWIFWQHWQPGAHGHNNYRDVSLDKPKLSSETRTLNGLTKNQFKHSGGTITRLGTVIVGNLHLLLGGPESSGIFFWDRGKFPENWQGISNSLGTQEFDNGRLSSNNQNFWGNLSYGLNGRICVSQGSTGRY